MSAMSMDFAPWWAEALLRASVQGGLIILLAAIVMRLWPRPGLPAWVRVWVWRVILAKMILAVVMPVSVDVPVKIAAPGVVQGIASETGVLPQVIVWLSMAGLAVIAAILTVQFAGVVKLRREARPCRRPEILRELQRAAQRLGLRHQPMLGESERADRPMLVTGGVPGGQAMIVMPRILLEYESPQIVGAVLAHELAHLKRKDLSWGWLAAVSGAIFFFHPLVWLAHSLLRRAQDEACDAMALEGASTSPADYGRLLVRIAQGPANAPMIEPLAAGVVESFSGLRDRLQRLAVPHSSLGLIPAAIVVLLCVAAAPSWRIQSPGPAVDWSKVLFVESPDGQPRAIPVVFGDGPGAPVSTFTTDPGRGNVWRAVTPNRIAAPVEVLEGEVVEVVEP